MKIERMVYFMVVVAMLVMAHFIEDPRLLP